MRKSVNVRIPCKQRIQDDGSLNLLLFLLVCIPASNQSRWSISPRFPPHPHSHRNRLRRRDSFNSYVQTPFSGVRVTKSAIAIPMKPTELWGFFLVAKQLIATSTPLSTFWLEVWSECVRATQRSRSPCSSPTATLPHHWFTTRSAVDTKVSFTLTTDDRMPMIVWKKSHV